MHTSVITFVKFHSKADEIQLIFTSKCTFSKDFLIFCKTFFLKTIKNWTYFYTALVRGGPFPTIEKFNSVQTVINPSLWIYCVTGKRLNFRPHMFASYQFFDKSFLVDWKIAIFVLSNSRHVFFMERFFIE